MVNLSIGHQTPLRKEPTITLHYLIRLLIHESIVISRFESGTSHLFKGQASLTSAVELLEPRQLLYLRETLWEFGALGMATVRPTIVSIKVRNLSCQNFWVSETWSVYGSICWMFYSSGNMWNRLAPNLLSQLQGMKCVSWLACQLPRDLGLGDGVKIGYHPQPQKSEKTGWFTPKDGQHPAQLARLGWGWLTSCIGWPSDAVVKQSFRVSASGWTEVSTVDQDWWQWTPLTRVFHTL